jgi:hypothetical protein
MTPFTAVFDWKLVIDTTAISLTDKESIFKWQKTEGSTIGLIPTVQWFSRLLEVIK